MSLPLFDHPVYQVLEDFRKAKDKVAFVLDLENRFAFERLERVSHLCLRMQGGEVYRKDAEQELVRLADNTQNRAILTDLCKRLTPEQNGELSRRRGDEPPENVKRFTQLLLRTYNPLLKNCPERPLENEVIDEGKIQQIVQHHYSHMGSYSRQVADVLERFESGDMGAGELQRNLTKINRTTSFYYNREVEIPTKLLGESGLESLRRHKEEYASGYFGQLAIKDCRRALKALMRTKQVEKFLSWFKGAA